MRDRVVIPEDVAAEVLFRSDRTCCVCRQRRRAVQLHHVDEDPANSVVDNLAALCLECHNDTQLRGGFGRKLDAAQVIRFREDWYEAVEAARSTLGLPSTEQAEFGDTLPPEVSRHDLSRFTELAQVLSDTQIDNFLEQLWSDDSYQERAFRAVIQYTRHLVAPETEFLAPALVSRATALALALDTLTDYLAHHFFDHPAGQQGDNWRYCLYPDHNVDRSNPRDPDAMEFYDRHRSQLHEHTRSAREAWVAFRRAAKRTLFV